jgi:hypothetical protein
VVVVQAVKVMIHGGGGGAGGFREDKSPITILTQLSPLDGAGPITVTATGYPITVGGGGAVGTFNSCGGASWFQFSF